jgi:hypothetical protein
MGRVSNVDDLLNQLCEGAHAAKLRVDIHTTTLAYRDALVLHNHHAGEVAIVYELWSYRDIVPASMGSRLAEIPLANIQSITMKRGQ